MSVQERRETKQNKKEERKKQKKKDYGRLRSDNDNEKIMQNSEEWKRKVK